LIADISVLKEEEPIDRLSPAQAAYTGGKTTSEVDIRRTLGYDLYLALTEVDRVAGTINLQVLVKPLINWIWIGCIVSVAGTILVVLSLMWRPDLSEKSAVEQI
jgi:cytochrome c-type biogenesis protein CcmF